MSARQRHNQIILESGSICTNSGEWEVEGNITTIIYISKGGIMPLYCGKKVKWKLLKNG